MAQLKSKTKSIAARKISFPDKLGEAIREDFTIPTSLSVNYNIDNNTCDIDVSFSSTKSPNSVEDLLRMIAVQELKKLGIKDSPEEILEKHYPEVAL